MSRTKPGGELVLCTHSRQSTGRVVHIPNKMVFSEELGNFHKGISYIWHELPVTVTFESDWRKAKALLQEIADRQASDLKAEARTRVRAAARRYMINYDNVTPIVYTRVSSHGVTLTVRYLCEPRQRRSTEDQFWEAILDAFAPEADLQFAYPTQRIYYRPQESRSQEVTAAGQPIDEAGSDNRDSTVRSDDIPPPQR